MTLGILHVPTDGPARAVFTTRAGGVSGGPYRGLNLGAGVGDDPGAVRDNRRMLCEALGVDPARVATLTQVHGARVHAVTADPGPGFAEGRHGGPEGDALATGRPGTPLVVLGADCVPVLVWHRERPAVAAAHAGWRGLVAGVVERAVEAVGDPARCGAAVGPAIGACCYPVSAEVRRAFTGRFGPGVVAGEAVDVALAAVRALVAAGVPEAAVWRADTCTSCEHDRLYSYRRDGARTGRQAGMVWL